MLLEQPRNANYCATVVALKEFVSLAGCDNVKAAMIFGNSVIVGKDTKAGEVGLFFPAETQLLPELLAHNNLYRKPELGNVDMSKKGFFEHHGRVKAMKFRGHKSEGFWLPLDALNYLGIPLEEFPVGASFDRVGEHAICQKYIPRRNAGRGNGSGGGQKRGPRNEDKIVAGQFHFHYDTENLRRNSHRILLEHWISISSKWHGTSVIVGHLLVKRKLRWYEKALAWLGVAVQEQEYGITWSSRRVIKGVAQNNTWETRQGHVHFYKEDIWGVVAREVADKLPRGYTLYAEIVGYTTDGREIQKGYAYGCQPGAHRTLVYRVTSTNVDGQVIELSWQQMQEFCQKQGLEMVPELWYGRAIHFHATEDTVSDEALAIWQQGFLNQVEVTYVTEGMCPFNQGKVPAEGVVIRIDGLEQCAAFKLKNFQFLERESKLLDTGEVDIETEEATREDDLDDEGATGERQDNTGLADAG